MQENSSPDPLGYRHIRDLEERFVEELGEDYAAARRVLERVVTILDGDEQI